MQKLVRRKNKSRGSQVVRKGMKGVVDSVEATNVRPETDDFKAGDTLRIHVKVKEGEKERVQVYEGVCISRRGRGANRSFTVRKVSYGVGVERIFSEVSPRLAKIELVQDGRVRRAKLYYLRGREGKAAKVERTVKHVADGAAETPKK